MAQFEKYTVTNIGATIDPNSGFFDQFVNPLIVTDSPITLVGNITINPTPPTTLTYFEVRWQAEVTLSTFSVVICGETIAQDCVNQPGTFSCYYDTFASPAAWTVQYFPDFIEKPQENPGVELRAVPTSGTLTLTAGVDKAYQVFTGSPTTLLGNYTVSANTGAKDGSMFFLEIGGSVTLSGNNFNVFGLNIPQGVATSGNAMVIATYNATGSAWRAVLVNKEVALANIAQQSALTVLGNATNATANVAAIAAPANGQVLMRTADTLGFSFLSSENFSSSAASIELANTNISSAEILDLFSNPVQLLNAPSASNLNFIYGFIVTTTPGSPNTQYATNVDLEFYYLGSGEVLAYASLILGFTTSVITAVYPTTAASAAGNITNQALAVRSASGNPTAGTGTISVRTIYSTISPAGLD
jgi:hypothetical protein